MLKHIAVVLFIVCTHSYAQANEHLRESIRNFVETKPLGDRYKLDNENLFSNQVLPRFYTNRGFKPAWTENETLIPVARDLITFVENIGIHGLQPEDYHLSLIYNYSERISKAGKTDVADLMKLDLLLTDAYLLAGSHLYFGKVNPEKIGAEWKIQRKEENLYLDQRLESALKAANISACFDSLTSNIKSYRLLTEHLVYYRSLEQDNWNLIQIRTSIKPGESNPVIPEVRRRLQKLRYVIDNVTNEKYDSLLVAKVKRFQRHHGLNPDGIIGRNTIEALNINPVKRAETIAVNIERLRWLPQSLPERYLMVNISNFELDLFENKDTVIHMRAIVGRHYRKTPVFNSMMTYLVFSPSWTIPPTIFKNDVLPELKKGPDYLARKNMKILRFDGSEVDYYSINWETVTASSFPFMIRQSPGADNALGRVKFMFSNKYDVYIHDTPGKELFAKEDRSFSSGCIRIESPHKLAEYLLADNPAWTVNKIREAMSADREQTVRLRKPIPVFLTYYTAWVSGNGGIHFRKDVYQRDEAVLKALREKPDYN